MNVGEFSYLVIYGLMSSMRWLMRMRRSVMDCVGMGAVVVCWSTIKSFAGDGLKLSIPGNDVYFYKVTGEVTQSGTTTVASNLS